MNRQVKRLLQDRFTVIGLLVLMSVGTVAQAENLPRAQLLAQNCAACHGVNGREFKESMPPLAGMKTEQFIEAMNSFKDGTRPAIIMDRVARGYSQDEIKAMAQFFATQPATQYR
ncbi:c-type cytochrome [Thiohalophilus sp.]|uniref:c-type cytochrome n=1 Tax=Thiohalophilus sp. TaxID=3028392 RepID=UPI002ACEBA37|nr:c-type cytochrome [Thiohalophilus sp.]MDZ7802740.1 c-type cytochrome [Thiohalophilus sp.]